MSRVDPKNGARYRGSCGWWVNCAGRDDNVVHLGPNSHWIFPPVPHFPRYLVRIQRHFLAIILMRIPSYSNHMPSRNPYVMNERIGCAGIHRHVCVLCRHIQATNTLPSPQIIPPQFIKLNMKNNFSRFAKLHCIPFESFSSIFQMCVGWRQSTNNVQQKFLSRLCV